MQHFVIFMEGIEGAGLLIIHFMLRVWKEANILGYDKVFPLTIMPKYVAKRTRFMQRKKTKFFVIEVENDISKLCQLCRWKKTEKDLTEFHVVKMKTICS